MGPKISGVSCISILGTGDVDDVVFPFFVVVFQIESTIMKPMNLAPSFTSTTSLPYRLSKISPPINFVKACSCGKMYQNPCLLMHFCFPVNLEVTNAFFFYSHSWWFPFNFLLTGLRISLLVTSSMLLVGKAIQVIPFHDIKLRTVVIFFGHLVTMLPSFVANGGPPVVSSTWFPPNERTTATAIGSLAANFGAALAFIIGPYMTTGNFTNDQTGPTNNATKQDVEKSIMNYFYVETGLAAFLFTCVVSYLPDKPPTPPSVATFTRTTTKISYIDGGRMLLRNGPFWLLAVGFAFSFGIYFGWTSVLDLAVEPFGVSKTMSGWLGTGTSLAGIISGVVIARSVQIIVYYGIPTGHCNRQCCRLLLF